MIEGSSKPRVQRKNKVFAKGRICKESKCEQILSQYNKQEYCFLHHKVKYGRVRGHKDASDKS